jgi:hypothetical protein
MRSSLSLLPLAVLALEGCVGVGSSAPQQTSVTDMTPARSITYMTPEQSVKLMVFPDDRTTVVQMRYLSITPEHEPDSVQLPGL